VRHAVSGHIDYDAYRAHGGYQLLAACLNGARDVEAVIKTMEDSGLRGLGGAGFPVGRKWRIVRAEPAPRLMAVNIDEGEPGTFKDRVYLERDPHRFLEGMLIAAWATGVAEIYIYLRDEYHGCRSMLSAELAKLRADRALPNLPEIHLRRGAGYSPEQMAPICGIDADTIRYVARLYASAKASIILWGMGISQHVHGTDNARCLIALALMTGQIGRPGTGLHPLRGQNNVQGASDAGLIPMMYPNYLRVDDPAAQRKFEQYWGTALDPQPGLTVVEIMHAIKAGTIRGMYIMGENPAMSDPDANHARESLAALEHLVVQDIFLTETAYLADVILPASAFPEKIGSFTNTDRLVQIGRQAIDPPGDARQDVWIIQQIAQRIGLDWHYTHVSEVFDEMRHCMDSIGGITWERLEREHGVTYPCLAEGDPGDPVIFIDDFPTPGGKARFVPADIIPAAERPDAAYPFVLITGRQLEHWHTGSMTRRAAVLDAIEPDPVALVHPLDLAALGVQPGAVLTLASRRGQVSLYARADDGTPRGAVFVPFCYYEAAINRLTNAALDPFAKIPEFKYCAIRVAAGGTVTPQGSYGGGQLLPRIAQE
jgi:formate dehydrogenase major subunit